MKEQINPFSQKGYVVFSGVTSLQKAHRLLKGLGKIAQGDVFARLRHRIVFLEKSPMPVGDDIDHPFQGLHFDMGQPFAYKDSKPVCLLLALYAIPGKPQTEGETRVIRISGLLKDKRYGSERMIEKKLESYCEIFGEGWSSEKIGNTGRICVFAKALDAISEKRLLPDYVDWFYDTTISESGNRKKEWQFYHDHGIDLHDHEEFVLLEPGQMLVIDNTRMVHSRFGKRNEREMWQILYGVKDVKKPDVSFLRKEIASELKGVHAA